MGMTGTSVFSSLERRTEMGSANVGCRKVGAILHSTRQRSCLDTSIYGNERNSLVQWSKDEFPFADTPMR